MDVVLVPGAWLDGSSWDAVVPLLEAEGHRVQALTLPGMEGKDADRSGVRLADQVAAVVAAIDACPGPVLLVGHSIGSGIAHQALDARPDRVARIVHVGGFPSADGEALLTGLDRRERRGGHARLAGGRRGGERARLRRRAARALLRRCDPGARARPDRPGAACDERRFAVPATMVCPEYSVADLREWVEGGHLPEVSALRDVEYVDLGGGHWPQLTQPENLARVLVEAAESTARGRLGQRVERLLEVGPQVLDVLDADAHAAPGPRGSWRPRRASAGGARASTRRRRG